MRARAHVIVLRLVRACSNEQLQRELAEAQRRSSPGIATSAVLPVVPTAATVVPAATASSASTAARLLDASLDAALFAETLLLPPVANANAADAMLGTANNASSVLSSRSLSDAQVFWRLANRLLPPRRHRRVMLLQAAVRSLRVSIGAALASSASGGGGGGTRAHAPDAGSAAVGSSGLVAMLADERTALERRCDARNRAADATIELIAANAATVAAHRAEQSALVALCDALAAALSTPNASDKAASTASSNSTSNNNSVITSSVMTVDMHRRVVAAATALGDAIAATWTAERES
jgi:hypothetical protein